MVYEKEAELFSELASKIGQQGKMFKDQIISQGWLDELTKTLRQVLKHEEITLSVKGSMEKGTNTYDSDVDVLIDTHGRAVSRKDKKDVVQHLCTEVGGFHKSHVKLKKLAIGCVVADSEVDLVFSNTAEYGQLPGNFAQCFEDNIALQNAARMLKFSFNSFSYTNSAKLPGFVLEILALEALDFRRHSKEKLSPLHFDGSLEIFCDALQLLVELPAILNSAQAKWFGEMNGLRGRTLNDSKIACGRKHARALLHLLCASRFYSFEQKGFHDLFDLERWVCNRRSLVIETSLGPVPSWLMGHINNEEDSLTPFQHLLSGPPGNFAQRRTWKECQSLATSIYAARLFAQSPLARYTEAGVSRKAASAIEEIYFPSIFSPSKLKKYHPVAPAGSQMNRNLQRLQEFAAGGSVVAQNMFLTRMLWFEAEMALEAKDYANAVQLFARSARASQADGDPFSGLWMSSCPGGIHQRYQTAFDAVLRSASSSNNDSLLLDAKFFCAWRYISEGKWSDAENLLSDCVADGLTDPAIYHMRCLGRGNVANWQGLLEDTECVIKLSPDNPMPYYWKGFALLKLCHGKSESLETSSDHIISDEEYGMFQEAYASFRRFIDLAPLEGRKVCDAWWRMSFCQIFGLSRKSSTSLINTTPPDFKVGDDITITGLKSSIVHNGKSGTVRGHQKDRILVVLEDEAKTEIAVNAKNLKTKAEDDEIQSILKMIESGFEAEARMLPILQEHEAGQPRPYKEMVLKFRENFLFAQKSEESPNAKTVGKMPPFANEMLTMKREKANELFRKGQYEFAVQEYNGILDLSKNLETWAGSVQDAHVLLSNRSAAYEKLGEYGAAEQDALKVINDQPTWWKGYVHLVLARLGCRKVHSALEALEQARAILPSRDFDHMKDLEVEAKSLLAKGVPKRCDASLLECLPSLEFKNSVIVVDHTGRGDFVSVREALNSRDTPSSIIVLSGIYTIRLAGVKMQSFQIIGEGSVEVSGNMNAPGASMVTAVGANTSIWLENLKMKYTESSIADGVHCVAVEKGASVRITRCEMRSSAAACYSDGKGSSLLLRDCKTRGPGAGPLVTDHGLLEAYDCHFSGSRLMGVEVRTFGTCRLERCTMSDNLKQGITVYRGALEAELTDCTIRGCGHIQSAGAVMVCCGKVRLRKCQIQGNRGDGIVVQDEDGSAYLNLNSCRVHANAGMGVVMYGGSANFEDNWTTENANGGISVGVNVNQPYNSDGKKIPAHEPLSFREVHFVRNSFAGNGKKGMPPVTVNALPRMKNRIHKIVTFDNNNSCGSTLAAFIFAGRFFWQNRAARKLLPGFENFARDMSDEIEILHVDILTGLEYKKETDSLQCKMKRLAAQSRMQNESTENDDFSFVNFNKESLIAAFERADDAMQDYMKCITEKKQPFVSSTLPGPAPKNKATGASLERLTECKIIELSSCLGQRASGKVLYGTLCTQPLKYQSLMTILGDEKGAAVKIALYNVPWANSEHWRECFPKGMRIGIKEPFLKRFADSTVGIRVDNPSDIIYVTPICICGIAETSQRNLKRCARCQVDKYCSKVCQMLAWKNGHKNSCTPAEVSPSPALSPTSTAASVQAQETRKKKSDEIGITVKLEMHGKPFKIPHVHRMLDVVKYVKSNLKVEDAALFDLTYVDKDGDVITIGTEAEFQLAVKSVKLVSNTTLQLGVNLTAIKPNSTTDAIILSLLQELAAQNDPEFVASEENLRHFGNPHISAAISVYREEGCIYAQIRVGYIYSPKGVKKTRVNFEKFVKHKARNPYTFRSGKRFNFAQSFVNKHSDDAHRYGFDLMVEGPPTLCSSLDNAAEIFDYMLTHDYDNLE